MGDGTELKRQHLESSVLDLDDGTRVVLAPWPQGDKAGATTNKHVFKQTDMCQSAYGEMYKACLEDRTGMPPPAPDGHLLTTVKKTTNGMCGYLLVGRVRCPATKHRAVVKTQRMSHII